MEKLIVNLGKNTYPIYMGYDLFQVESGIFSPIESNSQVVVVTNDTISNIWGNYVFVSLKKIELTIRIITISDGEIYKNVRSAEKILSDLLEFSYNRDVILIALGGGVIGDLTGFVSSIYQRGIRFIQIPTTLLAQVDASIGGKTAVNHALGKNMIGTFWQPCSVIINFNFLNTLPKNQLVSGMAEVVKYAISFDSDFFDWLEENVESILRLDRIAMLYCIRQCCKIKVNIVELDEREVCGSRMLLNLGHTFGHAIENFLGYGKWSHGEAVSAGMVMASKTSELLGFLENSDIVRIISLLTRIGLPVEGPKNMTLESYLLNFKRDKKAITGKLRMILPISIGHVKIFSNVHEDVLEKVICRF